MQCFLWYFALLPSVLGINQPHNSRTSHRGLRSNVYLPSSLHLSNPHIVKEKYCALFRANGSTTVTKIPVTMTLGKIFHYVTIEVFDTFYRTGRVGSLSIQTLPRNASIWSRLRYQTRSLLLHHTPNAHSQPHPDIYSVPVYRTFLLYLCLLLYAVQ